MSASPGTDELVSRLRGKLVVSCQPVPDGPLDTVEAIVAYALAAEAAGAAGLQDRGRAQRRRRRRGPARCR